MISPHPDIFLRQWNPHFEERIPKDRDWKEDFSWDMSLDFRVIVSSKLFNLHNSTTAVIIFPKITFSEIADTFRLN